MGDGRVELLKLLVQSVLEGLDLLGDVLARLPLAPAVLDYLPGLLDPDLDFLDFAVDFVDLVLLLLDLGCVVVPKLLQLSQMTAHVALLRTHLLSTCSFIIVSAIIAKTIVVIPVSSPQNAR